MPKSIQNRIKQVVNNLLPETSLQSQTPTPKTLRERMAYYHTPGVSVAVINNGEVEWARGFGFADVHSKRKVTTRTRFQAASISKPITALAVMKLVQDGKLDLDANVSDYLSSWRLPSNKSWQPKVTLRQLLSHTAGLTVHGFPGYQVSESLPTTAQILDGTLPANTPKVEVNILPGLQFRYSGGGTTVVQQVLMDITKKPFPQIMRELVLDPSGLSHSTYDQPLPKRLTKDAATAHPWKGVPLQGKCHVYPEMAAAGLWTTAGDLAKVGVEVLNGLKGAKTQGQFTKETLESMLTPQLGHQKVGEGEFVGLGFYCHGHGDSFTFWHGGWNEGFVSNMRVYKNLGMGAVIMANSNEGWPLMDEVFRAIAKEYRWPEVFPKKPRVVVLKSLKDYSGTYTSEAKVELNLEVRGKQLMLHYGNQTALPLFPSSELEFFAKAVNATVLFEKNKKGNIIAMTLSQEGHQIKASKRQR
jgi:CubicO group peptidase (beta-lactamase class C family)